MTPSSTNIRTATTSQAHGLALAEVYRNTSVMTMVPADLSEGPKTLLHTIPGRPISLLNLLMALSSPARATLSPRVALAQKEAIGACILRGAYRRKLTQWCRALSFSEEQARCVARLLPASIRIRKYLESFQETPRSCMLHLRLVSKANESLLSLGCSTFPIVVCYSRFSSSFQVSLPSRYHSFSLSIISFSSL